jgi:hypothetical protein
MIANLWAMGPRAPGVGVRHQTGNICYFARLAELR